MLGLNACEPTPKMTDLTHFSALLSSVPSSFLAERGAAGNVHCRAQRPAGGPAAERCCQKARLSGPRVQYMPQVLSHIINSHILTDKYPSGVYCHLSS